MGGFKQSGLGRRHGQTGIDKYTQAQSIAEQRLHPIDAPRGVSQETFARWVTGTLRLVRRVPGLR